MSQQSAAEIVLDGDAAELAPVDSGDSVVPGQPFVEERIVGRQKIEHGAVFVEDALEEQLGLALERLPQVVVEIREIVRVGQDVAHVPQLQPLPGEIAHQRSATSGRLTFAVLARATLLDRAVFRR